VQFLFRTALCTVLLLTGSVACHDDPQLEVASPPIGAVATGQYPNLFAEAGYAPADIAAKVEAAYQQLFFGAADDQAVHYPAGSNDRGPLAYILDAYNEDVRSEGVSYGMMIAVQRNDRPAFDAIWNWAKTFMYHDDPAHPARGFFSWSMKTTGEPRDELPAPDGEEYLITALYFADARWGSGAGIYDYRTEADRLLTDARHRETITGATVRGSRTVTGLFDPEAKMVRFTPDVVNKDHTDPSYHLPAFYEVWARLGPAADRGFWREAAAVSRDFFQHAAHSATGLTPDYANFDATPWTPSWRPGAGDFAYDAWRSVMNWSVDWSWWGLDRREIELSNRLQAFFHSEGLDNYGGVYGLAGESRGAAQGAGLVGMNATAGLAADDPRRLDFVRALWDWPVPTGIGRYYDGMLYLMALLHCSGEFQAWLPPDAASR